MKLGCGGKRESAVAIFSTTVAAVDAAMKFGGMTIDLAAAFNTFVLAAEAAMKFGGGGSAVVLLKSLTAEAAMKLGGGGNCRELLLSNGSTTGATDASKSLVLLAAAKMELRRDGNVSS
jgi:hypothetical protein